jgi:hypothetical protein
VLGEVLTVDLDARRIALKATHGKAVTLHLDAATTYQRVPLGETNLEKAVAIGLADISAGDRVLARGAGLPGGEEFRARSVIVISGKEVEEKQEQSREEWRRRGIVGQITALNPEAKEITVMERTGEGSRPLVISAAGEVSFRRYAPDSVRFKDARESAFAELKVGDYLRALGERNAEKTQYKAGQIVSGTFRTVGGRIISVKQEAGEIVIRDIQTQKPLVVGVNGDSMLRRLTPELAKLLEERASGTPSAASEDIQAGIERLPAITLGELKQGEALIVSSVAGGDPSRATAIVLAVGAESFVKKREQQPARRDLNLSLGLPLGGIP